MANLEITADLRWAYDYCSGHSFRPLRNSPLAHMRFHRRLFVLAVVVSLTALVFAQGTPRVTAVEPSSGKVNDNVTVTGKIWANLYGFG